MNQFISSIPIQDQRFCLCAWLDFNLEFELQSDQLDKIPVSLDPHACMASMTEVAFMNGRNSSNKHLKLIPLNRKRIIKIESDPLGAAFVAGARWERNYAK